MYIHSCRQGFVSGQVSKSLRAAGGGGRGSSEPGVNLSAQVRSGNLRGVRGWGGGEDWLFTHNLYSPSRIHKNVPSFSLHSYHFHSVSLLFFFGSRDVLMLAGGNALIFRSNLLLLLFYYFIYIFFDFYSIIKFLYTKPIKLGLFPKRFPPPTFPPLVQLISLSPSARLSAFFLAFRQTLLFYWSL